MTYRRGIPLILVSMLLTAVVCGDDSSEEPASQSPLQKLIDESVEWYDLTAGTGGEVPLTPTPVLRWDNNTRGSSTGLTVLYIADGRPEAACAIYPWNGRLVHEFDSLSRGPIHGSEDGEMFWNTEPGVVFRPIPDAGDPHSRPATRLRQMKLLSERFDATLMGWRADSSDRQELRVLPRPIYRYEGSSEEVLDGSVFAFVMGVDPEALLLIEAVGTAEDANWEYAFVRRTSGELAGRLDGEVVWSVERFPPTRDPESPHRSMTRPLEVPDVGAAPAPVQILVPGTGTPDNQKSTTDLEIE